MWNDIDLYRMRVLHIICRSTCNLERIDAFRDFTSDPVTFPGSEIRTFIQDLVCW